MRELTRKSRRSQQRPAIPGLPSRMPTLRRCRLSHLNNEKELEEKAWLSTSLRTSQCRVRCHQPHLQAGKAARRGPAAAEALLLRQRAGVPRRCLQLAPSTRPTRLKLAAGQPPGHVVGCQGTLQGSWEAKDEHNASCGESTILKNLGGKACLFLKNQTYY